jgi:predicted DNA-binding transcriptional regulator AlpA
MLMQTHANTVQDTTQKTQYARPKHTADYFKISKSTLWDWAKNRHGFPKPMKASSKVTLFNLVEVERYLQAQAAK